MSRALLPLSLILFTGCSEFELVTGGEGDGDFGDGLTPDIQCSPTSIDFGELRVIEGEIATEIVSCENLGEGDLRIEDLSISGDDLAVYSLTAISTTLVEPGGKAQFTVTYTPSTDATNAAAIVIDSNDPDDPSIEVALVGDGIAPSIEVTPEEYDFGTIFIGCEELQEVTISNVGRDDLVIEEFSFNTGSIDFDFNPAEEDHLNGPLPWTLAPTESVEVYIEYYPLDEFSDTAYLFVESNDPFTPEVLATQDGTAELYGENTDIFEQPLQAATDILFAVDKSCSMGDDIANVQSNFQAYTGTLESMDADFRVAIIVKDSGDVEGGDDYIDQDNADDAVTIATTMLAATEGGYTEMAFTLLYNGVAQNGYWFRDDGKLNLVGVSDEPEQSSQSYSYYVEYFQGLKDDADDVVMHAIGGDYPGGCATAEPYTGFYEATVATGGLFLSLCATDWGAQLTQLAEESASTLNNFELSEWPVPETIVVSIDSVQTVSGWDYEEDGNSVVFDNDSIPEGGAIIEISYAIQGDCDY